MNPDRLLGGLFGSSYRITSGYRTPEHNADVGGVKNSDHLRPGGAFDIVVDGETPTQAAARMRAAGVPARVIIPENDHVHWSLPQGGAAASGADIFSMDDAPAAPAAGQQQPNPALGEDIFADPPTGTPPARQHPIVITNKDTGEPYSDAVQGAYGDLLKKNLIDSRMPIGSQKFPRAMDGDGTPSAGEFYVDATGLHQAPGVPQHTFMGDVSSTVLTAGDKLGHDVMNEVRRGKVDAPKDSYLGDLAHNVATPFRIGADLLGFAASPVTGAMEGGIVQPFARAADHLPAGYTGGDLELRDGHLGISALRRMNEAENHDSNADAMRLGLSALGGKGGGASLTAREGGGLSYQLGPKPQGGLFGPLMDLVKDPLAKPPPQAGGGRAFAFTPEQEQAARYAQGKLPTGVTADTLRGADQSLTAAEAIGPPGEVALGALSRQTGDTASALAETIHARRQARGPQILRAISEAVGIEPEATRGAVETMVRNGRVQAEPLYDASFTNEPIWSPVLEQLIQRDSVKGALRNAESLMREEGKDPNSLGMSFMDDPQQWASHEPPALSAAEPDRVVGFAGRGKGPAKAPTQGRSLLDHISENGGIADLTGDVENMGGDRWHLGRPYRRRLIGSRDPDAVASSAWEAGYLPEFAERPTINDLYTVMDAELRGKRRFARPVDQAARDRFDGANAQEELAYRGGHPDDVPSPSDYDTGRPEPIGGPVDHMQPKTQTWDYIKRVLDDELVPFLSGKMEWTDKARAMNQTRAALVEELQNLNPAYKVALEHSGDYLGAQQAFRDGKRMIMDGNVDEHDFRKRLGDMTPAERRYFRAGIANKAYQQVNIAAVQPTRLVNAFRSPLVKAKLKAALGPKKAQALVDKIDAQAVMKGFEDRYGPRANSATSELAAEIDAQNDPGAMKEMAAGALQGARGGFWGAATGAASAVAKRGMATLRTPGMPVPVRNEAGVMLKGAPAELAQVLDKLDELGLHRGSRGGRTWRGMIGSSVLGRPFEDKPKPRATQTLLPQR